MSSTFEEFIMQCCKAPEGELRKWLKKTLTRAGFNLIEDDYVSERAGQEPSYSDVHNMLAVRGNPNVCLVAHTDICRDHKALKENDVYNEYFYYVYGRHVSDSEKEKEREKGRDSDAIRKVNPVIKTVKIEDKVRRVIQDENCDLQVGGDDRLGVAINTWIALNTGYDLGLLFTTDEEVGLKSASRCNFKELEMFDLLAQIDRGNHTDELVIKISGTHICSYDTAVRLLEIAYDMGMPRKPVTGLATDVYALKSNKVIKEAVNMTCGYHHSHGASPNEFIDIEEAKDTMKYVAGIVKDYYLNKEGK